MAMRSLIEWRQFIKSDELTGNGALSLSFLTTAESSCSARRLARKSNLAPGAYVNFLKA